MGKQLLKPPTNLEEAKIFLERELGDHLENYELNFETDKSFFLSMSNELEKMHNSTSIYGLKEFQNVHAKLYHKSLRAEAYKDSLYKFSARVVVAAQKHSAFYITNNSFTIPVNDPWRHLNFYKNTIENVSKSIGRVEIFDRKESNVMHSYGTGWLYKKEGINYIITNQHIAEHFAQEGATGTNYVLIDQKYANIDFMEEINSNQELVFSIDEISYLGNDSLDIAILKINSSSDRLPDGLVFADEAPKIDDEVITIGYPGEIDRKRAYPRGYGQLFADVFCDMGECIPEYLGVKRLSPGNVLHVNGSTFEHSCSTSEGSSGGPLINARTGKVVGIHYKSITELGENYAISAQEIKELI